MHLCQISMCQYIGSQTILPPRVNCSPWPLICSLVAYWDFTKFHSRKAKCLVHASCVSRCGCGVGGGLQAQGPHSHIILLTGVQGISFSLKFWPRGFFRVYERQGFFWVTKKMQGFLIFGCCTFHHFKSTIT